MYAKKFLVLTLLIVALYLSSGVTYFSEQGQVFDKSPNGYGWYQGYNRKVQVCLSPFTGITGGSVFRRLTGEGNNTIGGMTCNWDDSFMGYSQELPYEDPFMMYDGWAGGRYPHTSSFINGYLFGQFNDYDVTTDGSVSQAIFAVCDVTWGWVDAEWAMPQRVEAESNGATPQSAWNGTGDVVYDPATGYYYWTQGWKRGMEGISSPVSCVAGRTKTPFDMNSWVWSDWNDLYFDTGVIDKKVSDYNQLGIMHFAYAKDVNGYGTGRGIGAIVTGQTWTGQNQLSYIYTNGWGSDSLSGSWKPNWATDEGLLFQIDLSDKFNWLGETLTLADSIGYNVNTNTIVNGTGTVTIDIPYVLWDISVVMTEENYVHILCMVFPATSDPAYQNVIFPKTNSGFKAGYYDIRGEITDTGVNWLPAVFIANPVDVHKGWGDNGMEFRTELNRTLTISCMNDGVILAGWLDKPWSRAYPFDPYDTQKQYKFLNDGFIIASTDNGQIWETYYNIDVETGNSEDPVHAVNYAYNATNANQIHFDGWGFAGNTFWSVNRVQTYATTQTADYAGMEETYLLYPQFLNLWKVGYSYSGIEEGYSGIAADFELYQNYPNPFNPATEIKFSLAENSKVNLSVYNTNGQLVRTLLDGKTEKGYHTVSFDASELNSGMYLYRLDVNGNVQTKKMLMLK